MKVPVITDFEIILNLTEELKVTLNRVNKQTLKDAYRDDDIVENNTFILDTYNAYDYAAVLRNKTDLLTLISIDNILKAHNKQYLFIPNIMGVLRKYRNDIISPNEFYLASKRESDGQDEEYARFILGGMLNNKYVGYDGEITDSGYYIKGNFLIIAQSELITWKIEEKYVEKHNKELYNEFFENNKDNNIFGKKENRPPCTADFIQYMENNSSFYPDFKKANVIIYYVSIPTLKLNLTKNDKLKGKDIKIHESITNKLL